MNNFASYATSTSFSISLSRDMVMALQMVHAYHHRQSTMRFDFGRSVPAMKAVIRRGLAEHHPRPEGPVTLDHQYYTLTEAGKHVYELCKLAGLIPPVHERYSLTEYQNEGAEA